jgi:tetratricopeptide (TPR) repeat protein
MTPFHKPVEADKLFFLSDQKINDGDIGGATDLLLGLIEKFPEFGRAYNHLGYIYETRFKDVITAEKYYKEALSRNPEYPATYMNYAVILSSQERFAELTALLNKALEVPGISKDRIYNEFGIMHELLGRYEEAINAFRKAINYALNEKDIEMYEKSISRSKLKASYR